MFCVPNHLKLQMLTLNTCILKVYHWWNNKICGFKVQGFSSKIIVSKSCVQLIAKFRDADDTPTARHTDIPTDTFAKTCFAVLRISGYTY